MDYAWITYAPCKAYASIMYGLNHSAWKCMDYACIMYGMLMYSICMDYTWNMYGSCVDGA